MTDVIQVNHLVKKFGDFTAVNDVNFAVRAGEVFGYLGPNGSGKTTTMRMLLGLIQPTAGEARVFDLDCVRDTEQIRPRVGYMSQKFALYEDLTVRENLVFYGGVYGLRAEQYRPRVVELMELLNLKGTENELAANMSGGWRQRLALGIALVHQPKLLFLDEPTSGVDPSARREFWDLIYTLAEQGTTIFVSTHYMDEAEHCGRLGIMFRGQLMALDTPDVLKRTQVKGPAWNIVIEPLISALEALEKVDGVYRAGLLGDHLHAITQHGAHTAETLRTALTQQGFKNVLIEEAEPTLEDVFVELAGHNATNNEA